MLKKTLAVCVASILTAAPVLAQDLVVYSSRSTELIKPVVEAYEKATGTKVTVVSDRPGPLLEKLRAEGQNTPADVLVVVDGGNLWQAATAGYLQAVHSEILEKNIPANLRDPEDRWFGMSVRARTIFFNKDRVKASQLSSYEDLADPKWKGRLCLRTSKNVYNMSLVGTMIENLGEKKTEQVVKGWVSNLAVKPFSNDRDLLRAIGSDRCDVGIANTYYFGGLQEKEADKVKNVGIFFANQADRGTHVNVSGAGIVKYSKHPEEAKRFLEWLSSNQAQGLFASLNHEFPANPAIPADSIAAKWGKFKGDLINVSVAGENQPKAVRLMKRAGWN